MNKAYLIFKHEFIQRVKSVSFIILTLSLPVAALLGIGIFKLTAALSDAPVAEPVVVAYTGEIGVLDHPFLPDSLGPGPLVSAGGIALQPENPANFLVPGAFSLLLAFALQFGSLSLISGLGEEKESRLIEVLFSSVSVSQLLIGKVLALGLAGLLQVLVWLITLRPLLSLASSSLGGFLRDIEIPASFLALGVVYFVLGYLLFAVLSIGIGAISSGSQEAASLSMFYTMASFIPLWLLALVMNFPANPLWVVLTIIPVTAPVQTMLRLGAGDIPLWQILTNMGLLVISIVGGLFLTIKVFRMYMLMYGKRPRLGQIIKSLREA